LSIHFITIFLAGILIAYFSGFITDFVGDPKRYLIVEDIAIRIDLVRDGLTGFIDKHPFIGNGIGQGYRYIGNVDRWSVHNMVVMIADELGLLGILTYGAFLFVLIYRQFISILKLNNKKDKAVLLSLLVALIAYIADLQFQSLYFNFFISIYLGFVEAIRGALSYQVPLESTAKA
jgi:O-antigen ligase